MALTPACEAAYLRVFEDKSPTDWCTLGYEGRKLVPTGEGEGGLAELREQFDDGSIAYALLRRKITDDGGDSHRTKFIMLVWVGETASALKKGQVGPHKSEVGALFKGHHIEIGMYEREELDGLEAKIDAELKKAGGANYDLGNTRTGSVGSGAGSYKNRSKAFFEQKDKETEVSVVYDKGPLRRKSAGFTTVNLSGRQMVASAADAQKNTVDTDVTEKVVTKKLAETSLAEAGKPAEKAEEAPAAEAPAAEEPAPPAEEAEKPE